ncbi:MAG: amino acid ABC transporter permease [Marinobacterium sp.]|nr:amino acid ABC transporter permease [Marinobacterium sp.]
MHEPQKKWLWHLVFAGCLGLIVLSTWLVSQKVDYPWNWQRISSYIINTDPAEITAPGDGTIELNENGQLVLNLDNGDPAVLISDYTTLEVTDGDLIFEGDILATVEQWEFGTILHGLFITIEISIYSLAIALVLGLITGLMRISTNPALRNLAIVYIEIIRGTPLLVQLFIAYFFIATVLELDKFTAGVAGLAVFAGAYIAEIVRSGIQSIPVGQMEAARSLGMSYPKAMIYIILPQAFKRTLPPLAGQFINLIKDSSLVSVIAVVDLTKAGREAAGSSFASLEIWFVVALLYLLLTGPLSWAIQRLEKRLSASD